MSRNTTANTNNVTDDDNDAGSSSSEDVSNMSSIGPYRAEEIEEQRLVNVLEKEMLSKHPNVPWGDIAGLNQAKSLLQEAVILPILMPDYFQGINRLIRSEVLHILGYFEICKVAFHLAYHHLES